MLLPRHRAGIPGSRLAIFLLAASASASAPGAQAAGLVLKRVMLSSAGVGYFEYAADVTGPATLGLDVPLAQVDDVLKSLVVFDDAGGVGGIELPGRDQTHSAFGELPFGPDGLSSPLAFLNGLQGVEVTVEGPRPMSGRIMQAETVREASGPQAPDGAQAARQRTRVTLLTDEGLKQFVLEDSEAVQVADPDLRERISRALAALKRESGQDARHITIRSTGTGHRTVRVGYVAVAPLWKASYRLVLPAQDAGAAVKARMQGWATLENDSGTDWSGVSLTLQYGNPVTFHQAIYRSYFVARPEVPVEVLGRLLPDVDTESIVVSAGQVDESGKPPPPPPAPEMAPPPAPILPQPRMMMKAAPGMARPDESVAPAEGTEETIFPLPKPITLAAGHSASVPILDRELPATRLSVANEEETHPRAAVRVRNDTPESLPAGVLTLYAPDGDAPYAGDARLGGLPAGEERILSFAEDLRTSLQWHTGSAQLLTSLKANGGTLTIHSRQRTLTDVTISGPQHESRHLLLEIRKDDSTVPAHFPQPSEETATARRFALDLKPAETRKITLATDDLLTNSIAIEDSPDTIVDVFNNQLLSDTARSALSQILHLRLDQTARTTERDRLTTQRRAVESDEERLRSNLAATQPGDALHARMVRALDQDETRIAQLSSGIDAADGAVVAAHQALIDAIGRLDL